MWNTPPLASIPRRDRSGGPARHGPNDRRADLIWILFETRPVWITSGIFRTSGNEGFF
jgi:hypothetical protein